MLIIEMYPWHSTILNADLQAPADIIDRFVWQLIAELPTTHVFAFGRPWHDTATNLGLQLIESLGHGGRPAQAALVHGVHMPTRRCMHRPRTRGVGPHPG